MMAKRLERRQSGVADRRRFARGGRRVSDHKASMQSSAMPCTACQVGTARMFAVIKRGTRSTLRYHCSECGHQAVQDY
jgi:ribosomal protein L44E